MKTKVTVYSDYICPFCFIGKARLERLAEELDLEVEWRGLEIHPEVPVEGQAMPPELQRYVEDAGGNIQQLAQEESLAVKLPSKLVSTRQALEIAEFAKEKGKFQLYHDAVFKAYWQEGKDIGDSQVLFQIADQAGLEGKALSEYLASDKASAPLKAHREQALKYGISGVPSFIIDQFVLEGVQAPQVFKRAIEKVKGG